jgi:hypothetical protein
MTPVEMLLEKLPGATKSGAGWSARCPAHDDRKASLSIGEGDDGRALVKCHAGCTVEAIVAAVGLTVRDLMPPGKGPTPKVQFGGTNKSEASTPRGKAFPTASAAVASLEAKHGPRSGLWTYHDAAGEPVGVVVRWDTGDGKDIRPAARFPDGWRVGAMPAPRPLYHLPELASAVRVLVVEGEKAADAARSLGFVATTSAGGAEAAGRTDWTPLAGKVVWILPDNDAPGRKYASTVEKVLRGLEAPANVRVVELPGLPEKGDIADWIAGRGVNTDPDAMRTAIEREADRGSAEVPPPPTPPPPAAPDWPDPLASEAFHGITGQFVRAVEPHTEADPAALLVSLLLAVGNVIGRTVYALADGSRHYTNEFAVIVGQSSKARKGTSWNRVLDVVVRSAEQWAERRVLSGLSSGEGLIYNVRDPVEGKEPVREKGKTVGYETVVKDEGEADKRLLLVESEFANVLKQTERQGNTLSAVLRDAWDKSKLSPLTKNSPIKATNPHISIIGHITREELQRYLTATESANGFANRFLWFLVRRSKLLPFGGRPDPDAVAAIAHALGLAIEFARGAGEMTFDKAARSLWADVYSTLSRDRYGLSGCLTGRAEAHVLRVALIYAVLDRSPFIRVEHLTAGLAVWDYAERSVECIFGDATGNPLADELLRLLRAAPDGMTRTELHGMTGRNYAADRIGQALGVLLQAGRARTETRETGGRPAEVWIAVRRGGGRAA